MDRLGIDEVVQATGGRLVRMGRKAIRGISTDSRTLRPGDMYFAIKGDRFDGHRFAADALKAGAAGVVASNPEGLKAGTVIEVGDTRDALNELARFYRSRLKTRVVAVTGSNGKTTTREMIASLLRNQIRQKSEDKSQRAEHGNGRVVSAEGNYNNDIGVPLTVFRMDSDTEFGVFEIEMNKLGGTRRLARVCKPEVGVVTNVGDSHLESMHSRYEVSLEKAELLSELPAEGCAVVNADDDLVMNISGKVCKTRCLTFGLKNRADIFAKGIKDLRLEGNEFLLQGRYPVRLTAPGIHNVANCLAACGAAHALGMDFSEMPEALAGFTSPDCRLCVKRLAGMTLIDDCYNSNPQSLEVAIRLLCSSAPQGHRVAFLGDMLELGGFAVEAHTRMGQMVGGCLDRVAFVGPLGRHAAAVAIKAGMNAERFRLYANVSEALPEVFDIVKTGDTILVKGSRAIQMELVAKTIMERYGKESD